MSSNSGAVLRLMTELMSGRWLLLYRNSAFTGSMQYSIVRFLQYVCLLAPKMSYIRAQ